jgi:arginine-tRNA-protein transferase
MRQDDSYWMDFLPNRALRYYLTPPTACSYLPGQTQRKVFTHLSVPQADSLHSGLSEAGFRRSQGVAYRPACPTCRACQSVRVDVARFVAGRSFRRVLSANADVQRRPLHALPTQTQYRLFRRYVQARHPGDGMSEMSFQDFCGMVRSSPVRSAVIEYHVERKGLRRSSGDLIAASLTDVLSDGLSLVYSFFDPDQPARSLGTHVILDHIRLASELDLPYVYLGYWIPGSEKMDYKRRFAPLQVLRGRNWVALED